MIYTNTQKLPQAYINACGEPYPPTPNRFSATDITAPPYVRVIRDTRWAELKDDVANMVWMVFGVGFHDFMRKNAPADAIAEKKLTIEYEGYQIVGVTDLYDDGVIIDYKTTGVYSLILDKGVKTEWRDQLNIYRKLWEAHGYPVSRMEIHAIARDWSEGKSLGGGGYPACPYAIREMPRVEIEPIISEWIRRYNAQEPCTPEERWERPPQFAVMKKGRKTALRVLPSYDEAFKWADEKGILNEHHYIQERKGEYARCERYCVARDICPHRTVMNGTVRG